MRPFTPEMMRSMFDEDRKNVPTTLFITASPDNVGPNGAKEFAVLGCTRLAGEARDIRLVALVLLREVDGRWTVWGSAFSPPWTNLVRVCPVVPGPV
jgi:hypothetical protein